MRYYRPRWTFRGWKKARGAIHDKFATSAEQKETLRLTKNLLIELSRVNMQYGEDLIPEVIRIVQDNSELNEIYELLIILATEPKRARSNYLFGVREEGIKGIKALRTTAELKLFLNFIIRLARYRQGNGKEHDAFDILEYSVPLIIKVANDYDDLEEISNLLYAFVIEGPLGVYYKYGSNLGDMGDRMAIYLTLFPHICRKATTPHELKVFIKFATACARLKVLKWGSVMSLVEENDIDTLVELTQRYNSLGQRLSDEVIPFLEREWDNFNLRYPGSRARYQDYADSAIRAVTMYGDVEVKFYPKKSRKELKTVTHYKREEYFDISYMSWGTYDTDEVDYVEEVEFEVVDQVASCDFIPLTNLSNLKLTPILFLDTAVARNPSGFKEALENINIDEGNIPVILLIQYAEESIRRDLQDRGVSLDGVEFRRLSQLGLEDFNMGEVMSLIDGIDDLQCVPLTEGLCDAYGSLKRARDLV